MVTNTGNVTLHTVDRHRPHGRAVGHHLPRSRPWPRAVETCTATYTTTQADVDRGADHQHRHRHGHPADRARRDRHVDRDHPGRPDSGHHHREDRPDLASFSAPGTAITYSYAVTNTGNVTLTR